MADHAANVSGPPEILHGHYSDGAVLDEIHYLECKIILKPDRFSSAQSFQDFGDLVQRAADKFDIERDFKCVAGVRPSLREVMFLDTADFRLYNNSFILRQRVTYEDHFPIGDPEMVFKFRHPDYRKAAELDVRPKFAGDYRIKFKAEALPLRDQIGGYRLLYSHNAQFGLSVLPEGDRRSIGFLGQVFPALAALRASADERVEYVHQEVVEEVLQELGVLDFGKGITARCNIALWRTRAEHRPLCGEFAYQAKFRRRDDSGEKALDRCKRFFIALQQIGHDWVALGTTKTGIVYQLSGHPAQTQE